MAVTLGDLITQILEDTNRDGSAALNGSNSSTYKTAVKRSILTAIKFMESKYFWAFKKSGVVTIPDDEYSVSLPADFVNLITIQFNIGNTLYSLRQGFLNSSFEDLISYYNTDAEQGTPKKYALFNDTLYVYPRTSGATDFVIYYYYKDAFYPENDNDTSIWFSDSTVDLIRMKAMERFNHDTLQSFEVASGYGQAFAEFERNFLQKNNSKQTYNVLSV